MKKLILASLVTGVSVLAAQAEGQADVPRDRMKLVQPLPGDEGQQITIQRITYPAGWKGRRHVHAGPVYVYVLDGTFVVDMAGEPPKALKTGDLIGEPVGQPMEASNGSPSAPVTVLLIQVSRKGEPLTIIDE